MKKKDIITIAISAIVIVTALYFAYTTLFGGSKASTQKTTEKTTVEESKANFTGEIDQDTLNKIKKFEDYGSATLDNIGRANPFGPLN